MNTTKATVCGMIVFSFMMASTNLFAAKVNDVQQRWETRGITTQTTLWKGAEAGLLNAPMNLQARNSMHPPIELVADWWYGPRYYGNRYWSARPYRYYGYYGYGGPYYDRYPDNYYYGPRYYAPRVGVRVYPYGGRVWGGYW
jgi:hypothetical protein